MPRGTGEVRTDPVLIRKVLSFMDGGGSKREAEELYGISRTTIERWLKRREQEGRQWPDALDVAEWRERERERRPERDRMAAANRRYRKRRYLNRNKPLTMCADRTVRQVRALHALGWTQPLLAKELGVSVSRVSHLTSGKYRMVRVDTASKVDAVYRRLSGQLAPNGANTTRLRKHAARMGWAPPPQWAGVDLEEAARLTTTGARRRVRALYALGWLSYEIAEHAGLPPWVVDFVGGGKITAVRAPHASAIKAAYAELCMKLPPDSTVHKRQRTTARRRGYAPPLSWDDIDDPKEQPKGLGADSNSYDAASREADLRHMAASGMTPQGAAMALRMSADALWKWCSTHGHRDLYNRLAANRDGTRRAAS